MNEPMNPSAEAMRALFERWITAPPLEKWIERFPDEPSKYAWPRQYKDQQVELAWEAWQASSATQQAALDGLAKALRIAHPIVCSMRCPSVRYDLKPWTHHEDCVKVTAALAQANASLAGTGRKG